MSRAKTIFVQFSDAEATASEVVPLAPVLPGCVAIVAQSTGSRLLLLIIATGGSGGEHSSDRRLRSCGWGVVG
jgi:hypothetical protein